MIEPKTHLKDIDRTQLCAEPSRLGKARLDRNDRNQPFSAAFMDRIRTRLTSDLITAYPECWTAHAKVAEFTGVPEDCIQLHMGSEQTIKLVFETFIRPGDRILLHQPGYTMYPVDAQLYQAEVESQSCDADLSFDWEEYLGRIRPGLRMVVVENPN
ncbi:MAG: hypothetical protein C0405_13595, partial [Desulfovibrio sp.]|nr:hypothetical protein [Desulfovibrio sp.]